MTYPKVSEIKRHEWEPEQIAPNESAVHRANDRRYQEVKRGVRRIDEMQPGELHRALAGARRAGDQRIVDRLETELG